MKTVTIEEELSYPIEDVWAIFADVTRSDWVPAVDSITEKDGVRSFTMEGIGEVQERIISLDSENHRLQYSAIKTPTPLEHHLATIKLSPSARGCHFSWVTEIAPDEFSPAIEQGMSVSFEGLKRVLEQSSV
ncbi:MAG: hypothetical protein DHS20C12_16580 [Pseudohongiella sp.]|nr:MAG: hypothetical protein DHS20C12_16580 [Pseudohongiella sp.]